MQKQYKGQMTKDEEKELDRKLGNFYSITLCGKTHKINNCVIARAFIGFVVVFVTLQIIWLVSIDLANRKSNNSNK